MNCIVIDDDSTARSIISHLCSQNEDVVVADEFSNAMQAIKYLNSYDVDLIFLDIHMPDFDGFDFIRTLKNPPKIILITSDDSFAVKAFEHIAIVDYLLKPISIERFRKAIEKAKTTNISSPLISKFENMENALAKDLYVNIDRRLIKIDIPSIYLIEARGDYIQIKTEDKSYTVHSTLKKIADKLPEDLFIKVHRSFIINFSKIIDIEDNSVLIKKDVIPVSRSKRPELMRRLNLL